MSKQHSSKVMFEQSIVYLFNSYVEQGMTISEARHAVAKDIEEVHARQIDEWIIPPTSVLNNPVTKINIALEQVNNLLNTHAHGHTTDTLRRHYVMGLRTINNQLNNVKSLLEK